MLLFVNQLHIYNFQLNVIMKAKVSYLKSLLLLIVTAITFTVKAQQWSIEKANAWYANHKWMSGANYIPTNAINQLEMWQADTFSPEIIDKELGWAQNLGFNTMRVFLHSLAWKQDPEGFKKRVEQFITIAARHGIQPMFVFFDDCWNKDPKVGKQPAVKTGIHNSGWMQDPGQPSTFDTTTFPGLEKYVKDVLTSFAHDKRNYSAQNSSDSTIGTSPGGRCPERYSGMCSI